MDILGICLLYILSLLFSNMVSKFIFISFNIHKKATSNFELDSERMCLLFTIIHYITPFINQSRVLHYSAIACKLDEIISDLKRNRPRL